MATPKVLVAENQLSDSEDNDAENQGVGEAIDRPTEELVIGMVGAVGAGVSTTSKALKDRLEKEYGYTVAIIKASDLIRENASKTAKPTPTPTPASAGAERVKDLQAVGTDLREKYGEDYVAAKAIEAIALR